MTDAEAAPPGDPIADFYQRHPYPPPVDDLEDYRATWQDSIRRRAEHALLFPGRPPRQDLDVLVAGCGTFQAARHAIRGPGGRVTGIDVSETSIRHTQMLKDRYALDHLDLHCLPIEETAALGRDFDLIVCTGVLHHLADPDAGLAALRSVLRPGGAMLLMLYAPYGRTGVTMMQRYARLLDVGTSDQEIRDLAHSLMEIPRDHPLDPVLRGSPDFRRTDALADALLNPRDRTYSVPELLDFIERNDLEFGRWYRQAPYLPSCGAFAEIPHAARLAALALRDQYAAAELFRGSMSRHTVVVRREDDPAGTWRYGLLGDDWLDLVPVRLPEAVTIRERLPPGAAAVLLNRAHNYTDLVLPVGTVDARMVAAIDGRTTIGELTARQGSPSESDAVKRLFERLYDYDQVVFARNVATEE